MLSRLISVHKLHELIQAKTALHVLDTTYILPNSTPLDNHYKHRVPTARFLDLKALSDESSGLTLTMPTEERFIEFMRRLNVKKNKTPLVLYDFNNVTSPRAWFMFKVFGRENVTVLDGGLHKWLAENLPTETGEYNLYPMKDEGKGYAYKKKNSLIKSYEDIQKIRKDKKKVIVDARPEKGFKDGNIENSVNCPSDTVYNADKTFKSPEEIRKIYEQAGINLEKGIVNMCRIGHSASINLFAMELAGVESKLYDGSWEEWSKKLAEKV
jgi:thiosulfate/3-mercaptopyruvate sulfurtransferase